MSRHVLFVSFANYLDDANGASVTTTAFVNYYFDNQGNPEGNWQEVLIP
jgi:hypothetical protein